jgi:DNA processing protein
MIDALSANTQAILLLTAPLIVGRRSESEVPLSAAEYGRLAVVLRDLGRQPADLLAANVDPVLDRCGAVADQARLRRLLGRGFLLAQALERWRGRAIWVLSRADAGYPRRLKARLGAVAPPVLYGCGPAALLDSGKLAVVGSREVDSSLLVYAEQVGALAARAAQTMVSGGARGIDQAAMRGALLHGGQAIGVLADSLERVAIRPDYRDALLAHRLVLVSPYDPGAGFNVGHAMQRNKVIYALADAALAVNSDVNKGGTWTGAVEQLDTLRFVTVYVRSTGQPSQGLDALRKRGALSWPNPTDAASLAEALRVTPGVRPAPAQKELTLVPEQPMIETETLEIDSPAAVLFRTARHLITSRLLGQPRSARDLAAELDVTENQTEQWLLRLLSDNLIERQEGAETYALRKVHRAADLAVEMGDTSTHNASE